MVFLKYIFKTLFSKNTAGELLPYIVNPCSPWDSLLHLFLPFYNFKQIQDKNILLKLSDTQMLQCLIPLRAMYSQVHNFTSSKLLAAFYIGGNSITSARTA